MKITGGALASLSGLAMISMSMTGLINECESFQIGQLSNNRRHHHAAFDSRSTASSNLILSVSTTESSSSKSGDISKEISSGVRLTNSNNKNIIKDDEISVVDYASVSDQGSLMEKALRDAREIHLNPSAFDSSVSEHELELNNSGDRLMGINDDVVKEVGHEIGDFPQLRNPDILQNSAAYLRSKAKPGLFEPITSMPTSTSPLLASQQNQYKSTVQHSDLSDSNIASYVDLLDTAIAESGEVTSAFAKTFYLGTQLLPLPSKMAIWAVYVWCRRTDEIVDAPRNLGSETLNNAAMLRDLAAWEIRLERLWKYGHVVDVLDLPLLDVRINYPNLTMEPFVDMIRGMLMDIPELGVERYREWDELHLYCYRVAGTVGLMSMPIFGTKQGVTMEDAKEPALSLGVAFQITNILRDVGEDASTRRRIYLPTSHLAKFNVTESQLFAKQMDSNYQNLMKYEIDMAKKYYVKAQEGVYMLSEESRLPTQVSLDCYRKILYKIEENDYDTLNTRAYVSKWEKLCTIPLSWYRTQEINKILPLPERW